MPSVSRLSNTVSGKASGRIKISLGSANSSVLMTDKILDKILGAVKSEETVDVNHLQNFLMNTVRKAYIQGMKYVAKNMIGRTSRFNTPVNIDTSGMASFSKLSEGSSERVSQNVGHENVFGTVSWPALSKAYVKRKKHRRYFEFSGALARYLGDEKNMRSIVNKTGVVKVTREQAQGRGADGRFLRLGKKIPLEKLHVRVMPKVASSMLPGLATGNIGSVDTDQRFEQLVIGNKKQLQKLQGPGGKNRDKSYQRAMLQPIFTFWTKFYIPSAIGKGIRGTRL